MTTEQAAYEIWKLKNQNLPKRRFYPLLLGILARLTGGIDSPLKAESKPSLAVRA